MNHGLPLYFYKTLVSDISKNNISAVDCFRLCFEESLDKVTQSCEMDFMVRFLNKMIRVKTRLRGQRSLSMLIILIP